MSMCLKQKRLVVAEMPRATVCVVKNFAKTLKIVQGHSNYTDK